MKRPKLAAHRNKTSMRLGARGSPPLLNNLDPEVAEDLIISSSTVGVGRLRETGMLSII